MHPHMLMYVHTCYSMHNAHTDVHTHTNVPVNVRTYIYHIACPYNMHTHACYSIYMCTYVHVPQHTCFAFEG